MNNIIEILSSNLSSKHLFKLLKKCTEIEFFECDSEVYNHIQYTHKEHTQFLDIDGYSIILAKWDYCQEYLCVFTDNNKEKIISFIIDTQMVSYLEGKISKYEPRIIISTIPTIEENFLMNEEGDIKIFLSPKKSYMDKYDENHRLLIENFKNKNYEGLKHNLAVAFMVINQISRDKQFRNKENNDIIKARAFFINDFKTYLKHVQTIEPDFNFAEFYIKNNYDKHTIDIPIKTVLGVKAFIKKILLSI